VRARSTGFLEPGVMGFERAAARGIGDNLQRRRRGHWVHQPASSRIPALVTTGLGVWPAHWQTRQDQKNRLRVKRRRCWARQRGKAAAALIGAGDLVIPVTHFLHEQDRWRLLESHRAFRVGSCSGIGMQAPCADTFVTTAFLRGASGSSGGRWKRSRAASIRACIRGSPLALGIDRGSWPSKTAPWRHFMARTAGCVAGNSAGHGGWLRDQWTARRRGS